ncbi:MULTISPECIES: hypothetical protein [unclassified Brevibacillus]|uniref:hypothetical protein n=1 Tax=unclassified Brevibacillus TaxID=2684853 RepID=UPI003562E239
MKEESADAVRRSAFSGEILDSWRGLVKAADNSFADTLFKNQRKSSAAALLRPALSGGSLNGSENTHKTFTKMGVCLPITWFYEPIVGNKGCGNVLLIFHNDKVMKFDVECLTYDFKRAEMDSIDFI